MVHIVVLARRRRRHPRNVPVQPREGQDRSVEGQLCSARPLLARRMERNRNCLIVIKRADTDRAGQAFVLRAARRERNRIILHVSR